jgi:hypothetical protein
MERTAFDVAESKEEIKAYITMKVSCLLLNLSLVMGWYFGVIMNEELKQ